MHFVNNIIPQIVFTSYNIWGILEVSCTVRKGLLVGVTENLKRGVTELVLLGLLTQQDMYGYEMAQALRDRSSGKFVLLETSMYPTLYRLQDHHYISSYEELVGRRRKRTYYHIEPAGTAYYQKILAEYLTAQEGIQAILKSCTEKGSPE